MKTRLKKPPPDAGRVVLGIDPGNMATGYAVLRCARPGALEELLACGVLRSSAREGVAGRLHKIFKGISSLIETHSPHEAAIESVFYAKNVRAALSLGQARGAALAATGAGGLAVFEYSPLLVKQTVAGYGRAEKEQVKRMVLARLGISENGGLPWDAWDAVAIALCHACHRASRAKGLA